MPAINPQDLNNAKLDVDHMAALATSEAPTATDRFGRTKQTWAGIKAGLEAAAAILETGVNRAGAMAERIAAQVARVGAETARDASQLSSGVYATTVLGLAATASGRYFSIPSADASIYLILYRNDAGVATEVKRYPAADAMFGFKATLAAGVALTTAVQQGVYFCSPNGGYTDLPAGFDVTKNAVVVVDDSSAVNGRFKLQRLFRWDRLTDQWMRLVDTTGAGTTAWVQGATAADASIFGGKLANSTVPRGKLTDSYSYVSPVDATADANTLLATGLYLATAKPANTPAGAAATGYITVENYNSGNFIVQTWRDIANPGNLWVRYLRPPNSIYGSWVSSSGAPADGSVGRLKLDPTYSYVGTLANVGVDLNAVTATGVYLATVHPLNTPPGSASTGYLFVENCNGGSFIVQTWRNLLAPSQAWIRYIRPSNGPTFGEWTYLAAAVSPFAGKTLALWGDSKMEFGNTGARIAARLGLTALQFGFGGCRMAVHSNPNYNEMSMYRLAAAIASGDFTALLAAAEALSATDDNRPQAALMSTTDFNNVNIGGIAFGPNDFPAAIPIGGDEDMVPTTFSGAINLSVRDIQTAYPKIGLYLVTPTWRARQSPGDGKDSDTVPNSAGVFHSEFVNAILRAGDRHHLPVLDLARSSGVNKYTNTTMLNDGLHNTEPFGLQWQADKHSAFISANF